MTKLNERQIIKIFEKAFGKKFDEDVEVFKIGGKFGVIKIDTLVASTDIPPKMKIQDIARKSIVSSVSDFASKGVLPKYGIISISIPGKLSKSEIVKLCRGFKVASKEFGFKILGGDTNQSKEIVISCVLFGTSNKITPRNGARLGDVIITTGPFGLTAAGLHILMNKAKSKCLFKKKAVQAVFHPLPHLAFGSKASKLLTSSMDSSDGLSSCLVELARQSKKKFIITKIPAAEGTLEFARANKLSFMDLVFNGGEEYEIVATTPKKNLPLLKKIAKAQRLNLVEIGFVQKGSGVFVQKADRLNRLSDLGWVHFRN